MATATRPWTLAIGAFLLLPAAMAAYVAFDNRMWVGLQKGWTCYGSEAWVGVVGWSGAVLVVALFLASSLLHVRAAVCARVTTRAMPVFVIAAVLSTVIFALALTEPDFNCSTGAVLL
ncbi:MAG: hypothetical protein H0U25_01560 [Thermoleophilaceae bacterium]|nr:hypothetical protein [Thermoleophilaceae bacterium]